MIRIKSYYPNGTFTYCEQLYVGENQTEALSKFRRDYPEHNTCILVAEHIDENDPKNFEYINICRRCGCVNY